MLEKVLQGESAVFKFILQKQTEMAKSVQSEGFADPVSLQRILVEMMYAERQQIHHLACTHTELSSVLGFKVIQHLQCCA